MIEYELSKIQWPCYPSRLRDSERAKHYSHEKCHYLTHKNIGRKVYSCELSQFTEITSDEFKDKMNLWNSCPAVDKQKKEGEKFVIDKKQLKWTRIGAIIAAIALLYMILRGCSVI